MTAIRVKLIDEIGDQVPEKVDFNVGYYEGKQQAKIWLVSKEDLEMMYIQVILKVILHFGVTVEKHEQKENGIWKIIL